MPTEKKIDLRAGATHLHQKPPPAPATESAGVETLIARLRDEGIAQGRTQADAVVAEAKKQAADIVAGARREADGVRVKANEDAQKVKAAGEDAIRQALRDTRRSLEADLTNRFQDTLRRLVTGVLRDGTFLQRLILEVAGKAAPLVKQGEVLLPAEMVSLEDLKRRPEEARPGTLMHFVLSLGDSMLREGLTFGVTDEVKAGIRVKLAGENMQIDLTEATISQLLMRHMLPRFRAVLVGAVATRPGAEQAPEPEIKRPAA